MSIEEKLLDNGYDGIPYLTNPDYEDAVIGVTSDDQVAYDYNKMIECLVEEEGWTAEEEIDWIDYNVIRALPYMGENHPVIIYELY